MSPKREQPEIERLNPKLVVRRINQFLPKLGKRDGYVLITIQSLWNHSNGFLLAEDLDVGHVHFTVNVSYGQLAQDMCCSWAAAKWRVEQLRDKWKLLTWTTNNNPKKGNDIIVDYSANESESTQLIYPSSSANEKANSANQISSTVFPVSFCTGEERTVQVSSGDEQEREEEPNLRGFAPAPPPKGLL